MSSGRLALDECSCMQHTAKDNLFLYKVYQDWHRMVQGTGTAGSMRTDASVLQRPPDMSITLKAYEGCAAVRELLINAQVADIRRGVKLGEGQVSEAHLCSM